MTDDRGRPLRTFAAVREHLMTLCDHVRRSDRTKLLVDDDVDPEMVDLIMAYYDTKDAEQIERAILALRAAGIRETVPPNTEDQAERRPV